MVKNKLSEIIKISILVMAAIIFLAANGNAFAHCDTMDGPVVAEAVEAGREYVEAYVIISFY